TANDAKVHMVYADQQRLDGYNKVFRHANRRKTVFDKRVLLLRAGPVVFKNDSLVQVYRNDLDYTFKMERKLLPKWS
ncbi:hypothetical protein C2E23DRAFT_711579, partial [Lenzites betulinus]